jgi:prepilin-type N-terminal cleavage/methylation domain-containing protein
MRKSDAGFTLPEVLIASVLTLIVLGAVIQAFSSSMGLVRTTRIISETNESLQAGMSLMVRDFIQTGQGVPQGGIPIPSGAGATPVNRPGPIGAGLTFPATWTAVPAVSPGGGLGPTVLGRQTDLATVLYADPTLQLNQWPLTNIAADGSSMTVDNRTPITGTDGIKVGDIIMFTNAMGNAMQMVTRVSGGQTVFFDAGDPLNLNQATTATQGTVLNLQSGPGAYPPTTAQRINMITFYVDTVTDPSLPRLVRQLGAGQPLAIAMGVENVQFTYDLVDGTTNPTNVETPAPPYSANQIRKANLFLSGRSLDADTQSGQYVRNSLATEVGLRSLSFVDRYR